MPLTVAYLGPPASYTHQAAHNTFPSTDAPSTLVPYPTIPDIFAAVQSGAADRGVVPFENSTYGPVFTTFDLFASCLSQLPPEASNLDAGAAITKQYNQIAVCGEAFVQVRHFLLGRRRPSAPQASMVPTLPPMVEARRGEGSVAPSTGAEAQPQPQAHFRHPHASTTPSLSHIRYVLSHEQALGQCKKFLATHLSHAEKKEVSSTSRAAELAAADESGETAAISSEMAAGVYDLDVLRPGIQDKSDNVTRFMVLTRSLGMNGHEGEGEEIGHKGDAEDEARDSAGNGDGKHFKALVLFTVDHSSPGALADSLEVFKRHNLNLTSINTRPSGFAPWNYYFFVELKGRDEEKESLQSSLDDLGRLAKSWKCLGSWTI